MEKDFLDELMEALQQLKDEQRKTAVPVPVAPHKVIGAFFRVAKNHTLTAQEKKDIVTFALSIDGDLSAGDRAVLRDFDEN